MTHDRFASELFAHPVTFGLSCKILCRSTQMLLRNSSQFGLIASLAFPLATCRRLMGHMLQTCTRVYLLIFISVRENSNCRLQSLCGFTDFIVPARDIFANFLK